jgi:hypothetical protein
MEQEVSHMTTTLAQAQPLTAQDRCDRCGAQAYVRVTLQGGGELLFCAHHARKHSDALKAASADIKDETHRLDEVAQP